jgi:hypothetical protein
VETEQRKRMCVESADSKSSNQKTRFLHRSETVDLTNERIKLHINEVTHVRDRAKTWNVSLERSVMANIPREIWVDFVMAENVSEKLHQLSLIAKWVEENEEDSKHAA